MNNTKITLMTKSYIIENFKFSNTVKLLNKISDRYKLTLQINKKSYFPWEILTVNIQGSDKILLQRIK